MNTPIDIIIAGEQAKIELLRAKVKECEQRIATLRAMQSDDDIDVALARRLQAPVAAELPTRDAAGLMVGVPLSAKFPASSKMKIAVLPRKALNETTLKLLRFADGADKSIDDFLAFADQSGITKDRQGMRAFLHQYKATYGLLSSGRVGHFRLSDSGAAYLKSIEPHQGGATSAS